MHLCNLLQKLTHERTLKFTVQNFSCLYVISEIWTKDYIFSEYVCSYFIMSIHQFWLINCLPDKLSFIRHLKFIRHLIIIHFNRGSFLPVIENKLNRTKQVSDIIKFIRLGTKKRKSSAEPRLHFFLSLAW